MLDKQCESRDRDLPKNESFIFQPCTGGPPRPPLLQNEQLRQGGAATEGHPYGTSEITNYSS